MFRAKVWTVAGLAALAGGLTACGQSDVVKEEPTPVPPAATVEKGERSETVVPADPDSGEGGRVRPADGVGEGGESGESRPG